ncbi:mannose-1-phosphate guanylyltransferase/mannose-6-phosphate isomerase [Variovorax ureilyticus]|uniref:mannose-1-phosphate guanylyltransferase/mannose-6-phosphate isomerase n=1 Tax=Variovorax ureilyticus TaxID=1836198 RepID=UPI003D678DD2
MRLLSVVLAGGSGSKLWPLSRQAFPPPFVTLGRSTLLQQAIERGRACGASDLMIVTGKEHQFLAEDVLLQLPERPSSTLLLESASRGTGPAIALAALQCGRQFGSETVMLILPADQLVPDAEGFAASAVEALELAAAGRLVLWGVNPTGPDTRYRYIEVERRSSESQPARRLVEALEAQAAQSFLASDRYYWDSGMLCGTAESIVSAFERHAPGLLATARQVIESSQPRGDKVLLDAEAFERLPPMDIGRAVTTLADNLQVIPARFSWSDVGSWPSVAHPQSPDAGGNTLPPGSIALDASDTQVRVASHGPKTVALLGVHDLVIVDTPDALLVAHKDSVQRVDEIVDALAARKHEAVHLPAVVHRPWGTYASLKEEDGYKVKRITVKPGQSLSLQYHHQRAEHWVVVRGTAMVQVGDAQYKTLPGEYRYIPLKERHRLTNIGNDELVLIEVQCGAYLGEDDIVRLADTYGRA